MVTTETPAMSSSEAEVRMTRWEERTRTAPPASSLAVTFTSPVTTECMLLISRQEHRLRRLPLVRRQLPLQRLLLQLQRLQRSLPLLQQLLQQLLRSHPLLP